MLEKLAALGVQPRLVSDAMLEAGLPGVRVLMLPHAVALSDGEVAAVRAFATAGGTVLSDTEPGVFDGHGRRRESLPLPEVAMPEPVRMLGGAGGCRRAGRFGGRVGQGGRGAAGAHGGV